ncbi:MAG TPA: 3'-5' exonuclease [Alphaproteobacteria bacterium]|nr:3'-5' exonuclease [Alphaproteobacteria bacterium]
MGSVQPEPRRAGRALIALLTLAALGAGVLALLALFAPPKLEEGLGPSGLGFLAALGMIAAGLWGTGTLLSHHWAELRRLRRQLRLGDTVTVWNSAASHPRQEDEVSALAIAIGEAIGRWRALAEAPDLRLAQILAALPEAVMVVTPTGLVSLVNGAAKAAFVDRVGIGTSIFDALDRDSFTAALAEASRAGRPRAVELRDVVGGEISATLAALPDGGAVITCPTWDLVGESTLEQDLRLHEQPPPRGPLTPVTPLDLLPAVSLDTETTGLDPARDRVVSLAAVPMHGCRIFQADALDRLVDPGQPISPRSTAIHGISNAMVEGAPPIAEVAAELAPLLEEAVMIGHSIGFDLKVLRCEAERCGFAWREPICLDTAQLAAVLLPDLADLNLESVAEELGVSLVGRHTALGDALATAEIFTRLLPLMREAGARTLGDAQALASRAVHLRKAQRQAGW